MTFIHHIHSIAWLRIGVGLFSLFLLAFLGGPAMAQRTSGSCSVRGVVKDDMGAPIELASVRSAKGRVTLTGLDGRYELMVEKGDSVVLTFAMIGYETRRRRFVPLSDSLRLDVVLPAYGDRALGEAVVKGLGVQTGTTQQLGRPDMRLSPSVTGNGVEEMVATQAGVSTHSELSSQYNVRGGSFDENCVYLNGVEVYRPLLVRSGQQEGLSIINPDMVERIGFSTGGFEPRYGDRMSSVLDITYKRPESFEGSAQASLLGAGAYIGTGNKHVSLMTSVRYKTTRYLLGSLDTNGEYRPNFLDYQAYLSWRPNRRWSIDVLGNISDNHYNFAPEDRETHFGTMQEAKSFKVYFDGQEKDAFRTLFGSATLTCHFGADTFLAAQFSTFSTREQETYDIQGEYWLQDVGTQEQMGVGTYMEHARNRLRAAVTNVGLRFRTRLKGHTMMAGVNYSSEHIRENAREWEMRDSMGYSLPHEPDRLQLIYSLRSQTDITTHRFEAFAQDAWRIRTKAGLWNLTYGLRLSHWDWNGETLLSPRVSLGLLPAGSDRWTFRAATGLYYQAPFYKELRDTVMRSGTSHVRLNRDIRSQRSIHFVLGGDYTFRAFSRPFRFTTEVYYKALSNLIPYNIEGVRVVYAGRNMSRGYATGIDFKLFGEFVPGTDSWITFSLMQTKEKIGDIWLPRPTDQRYNLSLFFTDYLPGTDRLRLTLKASLAAGLPFGPPHAARDKYTFRAPAYRRIDLGLSYRLIGGGESGHRLTTRLPIKSAWVGVDALNLLGISNVNSYYWVTDVTDTQYAVPNYLTGRQINLRLNVEF